MLMSAFPMYMPVGKLFGRGLTHIGHLHIEVERDAGQRMVAIRSD